MSVRLRSILAGTVSLLLFAGCLSVVYAQQKPSPAHERNSLIAAAREIMTTARYCALITKDSAGRVHARTMDAFSPQDNMTVWLATNPRSRKVREIRRQPRVTLYYFNGEDSAYVSLTGIARLVNDPKEKARRWKDDWKDFYPDRAKDYLLIEVTPETLEVVNVKKGIVGDARAWQTPTVRFKPRTR